LQFKLNIIDDMDNQQRSQNSKFLSQSDRLRKIDEKIGPHMIYWTKYSCDQFNQCEWQKQKTKKK